MDEDIFMGVVSLFMILLIIVLAIVFFFWQKRIAYDLLHEKGYDNKKIGWLLFFMPIICWIYVCFLPTKNNKEN